MKGIELADITCDDILEMTEKKRVINDPNVGVYEECAGYYSAADICGIIEEACRNALEEMQEKGISTPLPLTHAMFEKAFKKTPPSISQELLDSYERFRDERA